MVLPPSSARIAITRTAQTNMLANLRGSATFAIGAIGTIGTMIALSAPASATTLQEAITLAIAAHPAVQGAQAAGKAAAEEVSVEQAGYFPTIDLKNTTGYERVNSVATRFRTRDVGPDIGVTSIHKQTDLTMSQMLFDGFSTFSRTASANKRLEAAGMQVTDAQEMVALRTARSYLSVLRDRTLVKLGEDNIYSHQKIADHIQEKLKGGAGSLADFDQARSRVSLARTRLVQVRGALHDGEAKYREATGSAPDNLEMPGIAESKIPPTPEAAVNVALANAPSIQAAVRTTNSKGDDVDVTRASFFPTATLEVVESRQEDAAGVKGISLQTTAMMVLRYNLYRGGGDAAKTSRALELEGQSRQRESELKRNLESQTRSDYSAYEVERDNLPTLEDRAKSTIGVVNGYKSQFELGRRSLLDLLDSEDEAYLANVQYVTGKFALMETIYRIHSSMGELINFISEQPPVDPLGGDLNLSKVKKLVIPTPESLPDTVAVPSGSTINPAIPTKVPPKGAEPNPFDAPPAN